MPPPVAAAAITAGGALAGGVLSSRSSGKAAKAQEKANREAMAYQRELDSKEEARYKEQEAKLEAQWNAEQARLAEIEARRAPYRQAAEALLGQNATRMGLGFTPSSRPSIPTSMPPGWTPGAVQKPRTLAALAGTGYVPPDMEAGPVEAPRLTLNDILNTRWGAERRVS